MDIVYAAEKASLADVLSERLSDQVTPREIEVHENPDETGSFLVKWGPTRYVVLPNGAVEAEISDELNA
ncbi:MAG: hypothetical protein OEO82_07195 [Gammaproteobacteria bacterium]|nr:hypothetical protein [Gammaproteobacteria bacterium]